MHSRFVTSCWFHHLDSVPRILLRTQKMGPTRRPETSVNFNQLTRRNSPQAPSSTQLLQTKYRISRNDLRKLRICTHRITQGAIFCFFLLIVGITYTYTYCSYTPLTYSSVHYSIIITNRYDLTYINIQRLGW
jgi:hypothetical protein